MLKLKSLARRMIDILRIVHDTDFQRYCSFFHSNELRISYMTGSIKQIDSRSRIILQFES